MDFGGLFKTLLFYLTSFTSDIFNSNDPAESYAVGVIVEKNCSNELSESVAFLPFNFDCSMPYPPDVITEDPVEHEEHIEKVAFSEPIPIVHRLPESTIEELHRFEHHCEDKIDDVYSAIKNFNNYNYEKNLEIQYLSYSAQRKQEILEESEQKKSEIETSYNKMHSMCARVERKREYITLALNPYMVKPIAYFTQPKRVPKLWYDMYNLETVVQQLFIPKLRMRTHLDEKSNQIKMHRMFVSDSARKRFIPLPMDYINDDNDNDGLTIDGASIIMENNHPSTEIEVQSNKAATIEQFNNNVLEQFTYSTKKDIQQIIIYYVFKYYEYQVQDAEYEVFYHTRKLKEKKESGGTEQEISDLENRVANAVEELQKNAIEMERNRVIPELVSLYNAENAAHELLPDTKFITKTIGSDNKRVITAFNPSASIQFDGLDHNPLLITDESNKDLAEVSQESGERQILDEPLQWDRNWMWDY